MSQKTSMLNGMTDGITARRLWGNETAKTKKSWGVYFGELIVESINSLAYYCALKDCDDL